MKNFFNLFLLAKLVHALFHNIWSFRIGQYVEVYRIVKGFRLKVSMVVLSKNTKTKNLKKKTALVQPRKMGKSRYLKHLETISPFTLDLIAYVTWQGLEVTELQLPAQWLQCSCTCTQSQSVSLTQSLTYLVTSSHSSVSEWLSHSQSQLTLTVTDSVSVTHTQSSDVRLKGWNWNSVTSVELKVKVNVVVSHWSFDDCRSLILVIAIVILI